MMIKMIMMMISDQRLLYQNIQIILLKKPVKGLESLMKKMMK